MSRIGECESGRTWNGFRVEGGKAGQGVKFERVMILNKIISKMCSCYNSIRV